MGTPRDIIGETGAMDAGDCRDAGEDRGGMYVVRESGPVPGASAALPGDRDAEFLACLALRHTRGIGPRTWKRLLEHFDSAVSAVEHAPTWRALGLVSAAQQSAFLSRTWQENVDKEYASVRTSGMRYLLFSDAEYPSRLREIPDPPILLYVLGDLDRLHRPCLAVVGSRRCSSYAARMARHICAGLGEAGLTIVSGFAGGVDRLAHEVGSRVPAGSVAVLGTGLDIIYPASNRDIWESTVASGLMMSEFAPQTPPDARNFPHRNRLISGISLGVLVIQAAVKSGSLITARLAMEQNRDVFAVPGPVGPEYGGCHELIQSGAKLVQGADDVLEELQPLLTSCWPGFFATREAAPAPGIAHAPDLAPDPDPGLSPEENRIMHCLRTHGTLHIDTLTQTLGWESNAVSQLLIMLEIRQKIRQQPGMLYSVF